MLCEHGCKTVHQSVAIRQHLSQLKPQTNQLHRKAKIDISLGNTCRRIESRSHHVSAPTEL